MDSFNLPPIPEPDGELPSPAPIISAERQRGGCLTILLFLKFIVNPLVGISAIALAFTGNYPGGPAAGVIIGLASFANLACAVGVWNWKKWGVYGFSIITCIVFVINVSIISFAKSLTGLFGIVVLVALVSPLWNDFE